MTPINFIDSTEVQKNKTLNEGSKKLSDIPVHKDSGLITSCWQMSFKERISALFFGKVWIGTVNHSHPKMIATSQFDAFDNYNIKELLFNKD